MGNKSAEIKNLQLIMGVRDSYKAIIYGDPGSLGFLAETPFDFLFTNLAGSGPTVQYIGGLIGTVQEESNVTVNNVRVEAEMHFKNAAYSGVGGFIGKMDNASVQLTHVSFKGNLDAPADAGTLPYTPSVLVGIAQNITPRSNGLKYKNVFFNNTSSSGQEIRITDPNGLHTGDPSSSNFVSPTTDGVQGYQPP